MCVSVRWGGVVVRHAPRLLPQQQQDGSEGCHGVQVVGSGGGSWRASVFLSECVFALIGVCVCVSSAAILSVLIMNSVACSRYI